MNKRILELAEQAGSTHHRNLGVYQFYTDELEKFAELIVRECINLCSDEWNGDADTYEASNAHNECADLIKEHFGVKQ